MKNVDDTDGDYAPRRFSPADGWEIVRHVLARLAATFGARETLARARHLAAGTVRTVLNDWLRPVEELARKLLFVMACALDVAPARGAPARKAAARHAPVASDDDPTTWRVSFRLCPVLPRPHAEPSRVWRPRPRVERDLQWYLIDRYYEAEAREARRAAHGPFTLDGAHFARRADHDANVRDAARRAWRPPQIETGLTLARRIEALLRVAADPRARALKLARRLMRATRDIRTRIRAAFATPHDRRRSGRCPAGLTLVDQLIEQTPRCDSS